MSLSAYLRRARPDVLISALEHAHVATVAAVKLARLPIPLVMAVQCVSSPNGGSLVDWRSRRVKRLVRLAYRCASAVVADSHGTAEQLVTSLGVPQQLVHTIYNPVITPRMMELAKLPVDHPFYRDGSPPVILGVGSLSPVKDFATLIRAFALVRQDTACRLIILGNGDQRSALEGLVQELGVAQDVSMPGFAKNPYAHMAKASLFALSSQRESMSLVLVEALALGLPVVATNCEFGPREILQNGRYGRLAPVGDPRSLADAMRCALLEPRQVIPSEVLRPFEFDVAVDQYADLVQALAGRRISGK
jgi:glycosyltransferase involved in cell wall biosynthesis